MAGSMRPSSSRNPGGVRPSSSLRSAMSADGGARDGGAAPPAGQSPTSGGAKPNLLESILGGLPPQLKGMLPGPVGAEEKIGPPEDKRGGTSWQEVCFVHSIPGDDNDEGLVILADGSMRKYMRCKGVNALLFDEADREQMARQFSAFANSCDSDIQIIIKSRNLSVDEYLSKYQQHIKTEIDYLKWYADYTDKWFRRVQDVHFVPQRDFYIVVGYKPPDCKSATKPWSGRRSIQKHEEFLETLNRLCKTSFEQARDAYVRQILFILHGVA